MLMDFRLWYCCRYRVQSLRLTTRENRRRSWGKIGRHDFGLTTRARFLLGYETISYRPLLLLRNYKKQRFFADDDIIGWIRWRESAKVHTGRKTSAAENAQPIPPPPSMRTLSFFQTTGSQFYSNNIIV